MAEWQSGYAAACKAVDLGSIPGSASNLHKPNICFTKHDFHVFSRLE